MSPNVPGLVLLWALLPLVQPPLSECSVASRAVLSAAAGDALAGEFAAVAAQLRGSYAAHDTCRELVVAAWAWDGWQAAVLAASRGGTEESLAGVRAALVSLGPPGNNTATTVTTATLATTATHGAYATAVLRAAAAAAQDEREEMQVWLEHARDLATRLALTGEGARWPLPIDLVDGELWLRVDDHELAEASYMRALAGQDSAAGWRGLARARDLAGSALSTGVVATEARGYLLRCVR